ncbi:sensor histidine kinase [Thermoanaerobacterium sp. RBIITD]|uniref:sensor histidine kinase n=1 Tax=Thermoanaerobacterium sp. RBIITD TaxID=1550240 RepID=UPI000BB74C47|nr:sensor histidine kinase [Thermoanaerobacterium sp. RBIITD]SNX52817.1 two-component system, NarL family, sensor histidine kinase DegS [Thermoanaerobacterium sp. RBIITD]
MSHNFEYDKKLDNIVKKTIDVIDNSKEQIYEILEKTRNEYYDLENEINDLKVRIKAAIKDVEVLERKEKRSKLKLAYVSKQFNSMTEEAIKEAYDEAKEIQIELILKRREEKDLILRRNELERKLLEYRSIVEKAEKLSTQIGVALEYLTGDLTKMHMQFEELKDKQLLNIQIIEAQEEERKRIAREIHDGPAQAIANVLLKAELCEKLINKDVEKSKEELKNLKDIAQGSLKEVRKIIYDLRPSTLDDLGLIPAVSRYVTNFIKETGINVELSVFSDYKRLNPEIEITCYRVIQEALTNIYKHSKANNAIVKLEFGDCFISIIIKDDGVGFNSDTYENGFGLLGMRERVQILNGKFEVNSSLNEGTQIYVSIPLGGDKSNDQRYDS